MGNYTNMWNETPEEQEKRREWLRGVYDRSAMKNEQSEMQQSAYPGNDNNNQFGQTAYQPANDANLSSAAPIANQPADNNTQSGLLDKAAYAADGAYQGVSLGFADEIEGAMGGLGYGLASLNPSWNKQGESFMDAAKRGYTQYRDARRNHLQEGYEKEPVLTRGAEALGAIASPLNKIGGISSFAPRTAQMTQGLNSAMRNGAIYGFGAGQGDMKSQLENTALGVAGGAVGHVLGNQTKPVVNSLFMNQTGRGLANNMTQNIAGNVFQNGYEKLEDLWKRRF